MSSISPVTLYGPFSLAITCEHILTKDPFCSWIDENGERCARLAAELDHVVPLDRGGDPYAEANMQGLSP